MKKTILALVCVGAVAMSFMAKPEEVKRTTPEYDDVNNVVEAIVAQYPGKTVFVDFWATWCGPCINAMESMKSVKDWMKENDIVTVYLSAPNSDKAKWENMIGGIGGNHYWMTAEEWTAVCNKFDIQGIPAYQIYNKKGEKTFQKIGFDAETNAILKSEMGKAL